ncbi:amylo-alpha-1,6-glucosidase [Candidatus Gracilibacteria bacterium]|nr:amylo-alpha-1,6-glucosidase [Candidatus Gracilibacteria bacterium]
MDEHHQTHPRFGSYELHSATAAGAAPTVIAGSRLYVLGYGSGQLAPIGAEHLVGLMGGIWCHPLRVGDGVRLELLAADGEVLPMHQAVLSESPALLRWDWSTGDLAASRSDVVLPDEPALALDVRLRNNGNTPLSGTLQLDLPLRFDGAWMGGLHGGGARYWQHERLLLGEDGQQPGWGLAFGSDLTPDEVTIAPGGGYTHTTLRYHFALAAAVEQRWQFLLAVEHAAGAAGALDRWQQIADRTLQTADFGSAERSTRLQLISENAALDRDMALAVANLELLSANYPQVGRYFLAGLPEYPQLFGCDTTYSVPGALAAGFTTTTNAALQTLARYADRACGRVPHEITTNGRIFHPGNAQETPQFTIAVWDYLRWTGDMPTVRTLFPVCRDGMIELMPALCGHDRLYPYGDGMVERMGMGSRKLDSACYYIAGLRALAELADALALPDLVGYREHADDLHAAFERDWWMEDEGLYADSLHSDGRPQLDRHWTAVLPLQLNLAAPERAARVMQRIEDEFVNEWGLVHTVEREELVWTLPTGLLALAAFAAGRAERGLALANNIALTAQHGTLGTFKELIPQGLCFVQLWSAALYVQAIVEGLLGLAPDAARHILRVKPCLPESFAPVQLKELHIGEHRLNITVAPHNLRVEHLSGPQAMTVLYGGQTRTLEVGAMHEAQRDTLGDRQGLTSEDPCALGPHATIGTQFA